MIAFGAFDMIQTSDWHLRNYYGKRSALFCICLI